MSVPSVVRMRVPDADIAFDDLVRGPCGLRPPMSRLRHRAQQRRAALYARQPLGRFVHEITHVLRGEDLLPSTPRQIVLLRRAESRSASAVGALRRSVTCRPCLVRGTGGYPSGTKDPVWPNTSKRDICRKLC
jgi:hypothetical protein